MGDALHGAAARAELPWLTSGQRGVEHRCEHRAGRVPEASGRDVQLVVAGGQGERRQRHLEEHGVALGRDPEVDPAVAGDAEVATLLSACSINDDPARATASALEAQQRADARLGDTGEDHIARVLAVLARRAQMRNTSDLPAARALADEAAQLAAPLRADGVAHWSALADACMRDAEREAR